MRHRVDPSRATAPSGSGPSGMSENAQTSAKGIMTSELRKNGQAPTRAAGYSPVMSNAEPTYQQRLLRVQLFIQDNLDDDLSLERLAKIAHFSPYHFHRIFRALLGEGVHEYVRRLRLESAAQVLRSTGRNVVEVALGAGYGSHEAFSRAFRQRFGVSPSEYRNGVRGQEEEVTAMGEAKEYPLRVEACPERRVAFVRHVGPYGEVGPTFGRFMGWVGQRGLLGPGTMVLGICHDGPEVTAPDKL